MRDAHGQPFRECICDQTAMAVLWVSFQAQDADLVSCPYKPRQWSGAGACLPFLCAVRGGDGRSWPFTEQLRFGKDVRWDLVERGNGLSIAVGLERPHAPRLVVGPAQLVDLETLGVN